MSDIARYQAMVERFPNSEVPRYSLAKALRDEGRDDDALAQFEEICARVKPDFMMAWVHRTELLVAMERYDDALPVCRQAIQLATDQDHRGPLMDCEALLEEIEEELA